MASEIRFIDRALSRGDMGTDLVGAEGVPFERERDDLPGVPEPTRDLNDGLVLAEDPSSGRFGCV